MSAEGSEFVLVRWVEDESYGVMPLSAVPQKEREDVYPGQFTRMKWQGKMLYDVEVLKVSSKLDFSYIAIKAYELQCLSLSF